MRIARRAAFVAALTMALALIAAFGSPQEAAASIIPFPWWPWP